MKTVISTLIFLSSLTWTYASSFTGCVINNKDNSGKLELSPSEAIGQSFVACTDGFLSHFSINSSELSTENNEAFIMVYEVINNRFNLIHQENEVLPNKLTAGEKSFWIKKRIPVYAGREYAIEILNISEKPFYVKYSEVDAFPLGSMIVNGMFTYSDLEFSVGIKTDFGLTKYEVEKINSKPQSLELDHPLLQSWSNKNIEIQYGDIGQSFSVSETKTIKEIGIKIKNSKGTSKGTLELYEGGVDLGHLITSKEIEFLNQRGERWELISFNSPIKLDAEKTYFLSFKFNDGLGNTKFYYSTAAPFKNGDMFIGDLLIKECDLSFFLQGNGEDYLKEIQWLEENEYENMDASPLAKLNEAKKEFEAQVFPNPFDQQFMLSYENLDQKKPLILTITNLSGTVLWKESFLIDQSIGTIDVAPGLNLASGKYNLMVQQDDQVKIVTIISR